MGKFINSEVIEYCKGFDKMQFGVAVYEISSKAAVYYNDSYYSLIGYTKQDYEDESIDITKIIYEEDLDAVSIGNREFEENGFVRGNEYRIICKDGTIRWINLDLSTLILDGREYAIAAFFDITKKKSVQSNIKLVTDNIDNSISLISVTQESEEVIYANKKFYEYIGIEQEEYHKNMKEYDKLLVSKEDRENFKELIRQSVKTGQPGNCKYKLHRLDGKELWMSRRFSILKKEQPGCYIIVSVVSDITQAVERELDEEAEKLRYKMVVDRLDAAVFEWDIESGNFYSSDGYARYAISKVNPDSLLGNNGPKDIIYHDDWSKLDDFFNMAKKKDNVETVIRMKMIDGTYHWCKLIGTFLRKEDKLRRAVGMILDVNEEYDANHKMKEFVNRIPAGVSIYRIYTSGAIEAEYRNDGYFRMLECNRYEENRVDKNNRIHPDDLKRVQKETFEAIKENRQVYSEIRIRKDDGEYIWVSVRADMFENDGQMARFYCSFSNISELRNIQERLVSDHNAAKAAMQEAISAKRKLLAITNNIPGTIVELEVVNNKIIPTYISDNCKSIVGYTAEEFLDRYKDDISMDIHPRFRNQLKDYRWFDTDNDKDRLFLFEFKHKSGEYIYLKFKVSPVFNGDKLEYYGVITKETKKEEAERNYQHMINKMEEEHDKSLIACGRYDITTNKILFYDEKNSESLHIKEGNDYDEALTKMLSIAATDKERDRIKSKLDRSALIEAFRIGDAEGTIEFNRISNNSGTFWTRKKYTMVTEPFSGDIILFLYSYNITDQIQQKQIITKLGEREYDTLGLIDVETRQYMSKIINGVSVMNMHVNYDLLDDFDMLVEKIAAMGVPAEEVKDFSDKMKLDNIIKGLSEKESYFVYFSFEREKKELCRKVINFCYLDDNKTSILCYSMDVTEMFRMEQRYINKLERALEEVGYANKSKADFYARMSHDMRTPMNAIIGLSLLSEGEDDSEVLHENIRKMKDSGKYLLGIINDTLDIQKIERGRFTLEPKVVNAKTIMDSVDEIIIPLVKKKNIKLNIINNGLDCDANVKADDLRIKQIFINLISNAIKFTPARGNITFEYACIDRVGNMSECEFKVSDNGIGMSQDFVKNKLFKPFSQEYSRGSENYASTGLGLSIVKKLIELMQGSISVESQLNKGTTFTIKINFERVSKEDIARDNKLRELHEDELKEYLRDANVMIAEDVEINAEIVQLFLNKVSCKSEWVKNGKECVERFNNSRIKEFDAILMDVRMPIMNGIEAVIEIRKLDREDAKTIPIIALSANAYLSDKQLSIDAGMDEHLAKPIEPNKLYSTLANCIIRRI